MNNKYVKVMFGNKSGVNGFEYKIGKVIVQVNQHHMAYSGQIRL